MGVFEFNGVVKSSDMCYEIAVELCAESTADLFELVSAPAGGGAFVGAPPPLICPGPGGLDGETKKERVSERERET